MSGSPYHRRQDCHMVNPYYSLLTFGFNVKLLTKIQFAARYAAYKHKFRVAEVFYPPDKSFIELPLQKKKMAT